MLTSLPIGDNKGDKEGGQQFCLHWSQQIDQLFAEVQLGLVARSFSSFSFMCLVSTQSLSVESKATEQRLPFLFFSFPFFCPLNKQQRTTIVSTLFTVSPRAWHTFSLVYLVANTFGVALHHPLLGYFPQSTLCKRAYIYQI